MSTVFGHGLQWYPGRMRTWLRKLLGRREPVSSSAPEADAADDPAVSRARATGGRPGDERGDNPSTGPGHSGTFVGRVEGQDLGYAEETGAERRSTGRSDEPRDHGRP